MKRTIKTGMILLMLIILILTLTSNVSAYTAKTSLSTDATLKEGETITIKFKLSSLDLGNGVDALQAKLEYDESVFESITSTDILGTNGWSMNGYSTNSKKFTATRSSLMTTDGDVIAVSLKVKSGITAKTTKVTMKDIIVSGGQADNGGTGDVELSDASVTINAPQSSNNVNVDKTNTTVTNKTDTTQTQKPTLPKTGITPITVIAIIALAAIAIISFILYKKNSLE